MLDRSILGPGFPINFHPFICILAQLTKRLMERKTGITFKEIMDELEPLKANILNVKSEKICQRNETTSRQEEIFKSPDAEIPARLLVETKNNPEIEGRLAV